jgi:hypothetical protein
MMVAEAFEKVRVLQSVLAVCSSSSSSQLWP